MAVVKMKINKSDKPSKEQILKMREAQNKPIFFDEDSPEMTKKCYQISEEYGS